MPEKLNILFITQLYPLTEDSTNSFALHYFVEEWKKKHDLQVLRIYLPYEEEKKPVTSQIKIQNNTIDIIKPVWIPILKICLINKKKILKKIKNKPDIIICHLYNSYLTFSFLKNKYHVPFIAGIHRSDVLLAKNPFQRLRVKSVLKKADLVSFRSFAIKKNMNELISLSENKTFIANSGIPEDLIRKAQNSLEIKNFRKNKTIRILSVCRLIKLKQIDVVIQALFELKKEGIHWEYTIIGDGPERKKLENLTQNLNLTEQIKFKGVIPRDEVFHYMSDNDVFIMPSYNETFGLVYLEAMADSCIIIGAYGWGIDGIIRNNDNGFLCNPYDHADIKNAIRKVLTMNDNLFSKIITKSLETVINFSIENKSNEYLNAIKL